MKKLWHFINRKKQRHRLSKRNLLQAETHHRLKNQLQLIASLLRRDADAVKNLAAAQNALRQNADRIAAMGVLHDLLTEPYASLSQAASPPDSDKAKIAQIFLPNYLQHLAEMLAKMALNEIGVTCDVDGDDVWVPMEQATRIGLIVCEIVTNAVKHAFGDNRNRVNFAQVTLALRCDPHGKCRLLVMDNGRGMVNAESESEFPHAPNAPNAPHAPHAPSHGIGLLVSLAEPIGSLTQQSGRFGTLYCLEFQG